MQCHKHAGLNVVYPDGDQETLFQGVLRLVFEGPVRSAFLPQSGQPATATGSTGHLNWKDCNQTA